MRELSIFVDESGDFGLNDMHSPYYIVTMVFHNQDVDLSDVISQLDRRLENLDYKEYAVHTEPLIRREYPYQHFTPNERRAIFTKLYYFAVKSDITYKTFVFYKSDYNNIFKMEARIARDISQFIRNNLEFFQDFENVILYYDNGQHELNRILNTVLATELATYNVRKVIPSEYRLFQVADLICTLELLKLKIAAGKNLTRSEELIFHSKRDLKKDFFKGISRKEFLGK